MIYFMPPHPCYDSSILWRGPGPAREEKDVCMPVVERRRKKMHRCALVANAVELLTHMVGEREFYKEQRDVLEEMRSIHGCGMEKFGTLDSSEKTIAT